MAGIELNISCPNVGRGGLQFALDAEAAGQVTAAVRRATDLPLMVKLSPAAADVRGIAQAIEDAGADAISAVNTLSGMALDRRAPRPLLGNTYGGLSRPGPQAGRRCASCTRWRRWCACPSWPSAASAPLDDVLDFLMAGACAVQVGTAVFADPIAAAAPGRRAGGLVRGHGLASHRELIGVALPPPRARADRSPSVKGVEYRP